MAYYRIYLLSAADKICGFRETSSDSDDDALDVARLALADASAVEVWERARRVRRYAVASECHAT